ncbi:MAG: Gfo/Idh/MocA family oxidoreductase [Segetibacter sp.]|jgi:predicted dehydrogenase|nr:Gfo/Idh/MocA family oxidoreductase [Segetibacter sp.]
MKTINWGIIGCGDVTEVKSGPAFNKVNNSKLIAVMRRDAAKAKDYAQRHHVPKWYSDAQQLINDPEVNAIYVATPPLSHEEYTLAALQAGKPVYVEKPMALNNAASERMLKASAENNMKLSVAHYRREQPMFKKIKELLHSNAIGEIRLANLQFFKSAVTATELEQPKTKWRVDPAIAGGGLFHDLAPHQLDLMLHFFGKFKTASGISLNQGGLYDADDIVSGYLQFDNSVVFQGLWCFTVGATEEKDLCEIIGSQGKISFSIFGDYTIIITRAGNTETLNFDKLEHVQQPMINKVVEYFLDQSPNPCSAEDGVEVMRILDVFTNR